MADETNLPAKLDPGALVPASPADLVPSLIADAGEHAAWRYIDFFTANIRNPNTRRAYARACNQFFAWCEEHGRSLATVRPFDVASYVEARQRTHSAPGSDRRRHSWRSWICAAPFCTRFLRCTRRSRVGGLLAKHGVWFAL